VTRDLDRQRMRDAGHWQRLVLALWLVRSPHEVRGWVDTLAKALEAGRGAKTRGKA
jgi:hypothetical protein